MGTNPTTSIDDAGPTLPGSALRRLSRHWPHHAGRDGRSATSATSAVGAPGQAGETPARPLMRLTVIGGAACHFCDDANAVLHELAGRYPIEVANVAAESAAGRELIAHHGAPMLPLVLVDGNVFSWGRLPRRKLERLLAAAPGAGS